MVKSDSFSDLNEKEVYLINGGAEKEIYKSNGFFLFDLLKKFFS